MSKMSNILLLINLLHHRRFVKPSEIRRICGISNRSLYRYLNTISAGYFPVVFDRALGGYRLLEKSAISLDKLNLDEVIIISVALENLSKSVNETYRQKIETIWGKLFSNQSASLEEIWQVFRENIRTGSEKKDMSHELTELIIKTAVLTGKDLDIDLDYDKSGPKKKKFRSPLLAFDGAWIISEKNAEIQQSIPLEEIKSAHISG
jgi:predicted DNA-binding transcriptional regulator YafY